MKYKFHIIKKCEVLVKHLPKTVMVFIISIIIMTSFSSCSQEMFNLDELMHPPKMGEEQAQIYEALTAVVGTNITLRYPKSGENRSAFTMEDLDGDFQSEGIVLYEDSSRSNVIRINILKKTNNKWISVYDAAGLSTDIEKIGIVSFALNSPKQLVIGFDLVDGNKKSLVVYEWNDNGLSPVFTENYLFFDFVKLNRENFSSLMLINSNENGNEAKIVKKSSSNFAIVAQTKLNPLSKTYSHLTVSTGVDDTTYFYLASSRGVGLSTEIIAYESYSLKNITMSDKVDFEQLTYRTSNMYSKDIDNDQIVEIPVFQPLPGFEKAEAENKKYYIKWCHFSGKNDSIVLNPKLYTVTNNRYNYYFIMPETWVEKVTLSDSNTTENIWTFIKYDSNIYFNEEEIFSVGVFKNSELDDQKRKILDEEGYIYLLSDGTNKIYGKINKNSNQNNQEFKIEINELSKRIKLIK